MNRRVHIAAKWISQGNNKVELYVVSTFAAWGDAHRENVALNAENHFDQLSHAKHCKT